MRKNKINILVALLIIGFCGQGVRVQGARYKGAMVQGAMVQDVMVQGARVQGGPRMTFDKEFVELGEVKKGEHRTLFYELTNTGDEDLVIELISACDCTTVTYSKDPIKPGQTIRFDVEFDSSDKDESEEIDIDIFFTNIDPEFDAPLIRTLKYHFDLVF